MGEVTQMITRRIEDTHIVKSWPESVLCYNEDGILGLGCVVAVRVTKITSDGQSERGAGRVLTRQYVTARMPPHRLVRTPYDCCIAASEPWKSGSQEASITLPCMRQATRRRVWAGVLRKRMERWPLRPDEPRIGWPATSTDMSIISEQVRRLDTQIDRIQFHLSESAQKSAAVAAITQQPADVHEEEASAATQQTIATLTAIARALSVGSPSRPLLHPSHLLQLLHRSVAPSVQPTSAALEDGYISDLQWIIAAKASVQGLGLVMRALLEESIPLNDSIWYWDEVLSSHIYTGLYTMQMLPVRLWQQARGIFHTFRRRRMEARVMGMGASSLSLSGRWRNFYSIVHQSIKERSLVQSKMMRILSPFALCRSQVRSKRKHLRKVREVNACAIGLLVEEGLVFEMEDEDSGYGDNGNVEKLGDWKDVVRRTVVLLRVVLEKVGGGAGKIAVFENTVFVDVEHLVHAVEHPSHIFQQLIQVLEESLPGQRASTAAMINKYGYPSRIIRYWIPVSILFFSLGTILNTLTNRRVEIWTWISELGSTMVDFWANWVIDPLRRLIGTIRHDETSEVAIMSKHSLQADRASLERMVVDFATDVSGHKSWTQAEIDVLRSEVKEGDLTPVLKAYERDLKNPFFGTVRGDLILDVEIAIGGIDALLKSQELVFGFVGLTPGILVSYAVFRWVTGTFGNRAGLRRGKKQEDMVRALSAVHRVLTASTTTHDGILSCKDHGLLLCETDILCQRAQNLLPGATYHEFQEDIRDLLNVRVGITRQLRILERVRWAYAKWTR
ncbi:predicted protein [Histoplasma mississippiense (nom. inval.)]|uniref:predicted protein n=1 Tax=Ajellomyces capsulatus (strain NAm1 / WU24) TaxID=2059318 RepID=UPI000157CFB5|nr:predicted protein [Histoplasma mississippiense (nom. inval.)]EDN11198.1 predicted protein [Histoplasma mississippiense (nom. inval.)]